MPQQAGWSAGLFAPTSSSLPNCAEPDWETMCQRLPSFHGDTSYPRDCHTVLLDWSNQAPEVMSITRCPRCGERT